MEVGITLGGLAALIAFAVFCGWRGAHPFDPRRGVRLAPWRALMLTAGFGAIVLATHLVNLLGVQTGR